jgi:hypothetical protein
MHLVAQVLNLINVIQQSDPILTDKLPLIDGTWVRAAFHSP